MKKNNLFIIASTAVLLVPAIVTNVEEVYAANKFKDVDSNNEYKSIIEEMSAKGIINGYPDGSFKPTQNVSRQHAAALITRSATLPQSVDLIEFKDVGEKHPYYEAISRIQMGGIISADSKGNFNPNTSLTRGEMAKTLAIAYGLNTSGTHPLKDVSSTYNKYVAALYNAGITTGYSDGTFGENKTLSRAHYAVFMHRAMKYLENASSAKPGASKDTLSDKRNPGNVDLSSYSDQIVIAFKSDGSSVDLPKGQTDRAALTKKTSDLKSDAIGVVLANGGLRTGGSVDAISMSHTDPEIINTGISVIQKYTSLYREQIIQIVNYMSLTGEIFTGDNFILYIDWNRNLVTVTTFKNK